MEDPDSTIHTVLNSYDIFSDDVAMVYLSQDPYHDSFEETLDVCKLDLDRTPTAGMRFLTKDGHLLLASIEKLGFGMPGLSRSIT